MMALMCLTAYTNRSHKHTRMASLSQATSRTMGMVLPAAMVVIGSLMATVATDVLKGIYDIPLKGGDAAYPFATAILLNAFVGGRTVRMVSVGMVSSSVTTFAKSYGLV